MDRKLVITIEREYGSGGRITGKKLSEQLGIPYYDDDILKMASEQSAVGEQYFRMNDEKAGNNLLAKIVGGMHNSLGAPKINDNITNPDNLFRFQSEVIRQLAEQQSCILIGRCSDFVLKSVEYTDFISVFVYCDLSTKVKRVMEVDGVDTKEALNRVQKIDRTRRDYYKYYTGEEWSDMTHYDFPVNTTKITLDQAAELITHYIRMRGYDI